MNKKRIMIGIIAAVLAVVCIVVFTQRKSPEGSLPNHENAAAEQENALEPLDPDSPVAILPEDEAEGIVRKEEENSEADNETAADSGTAGEKKNEAVQDDKGKDQDAPAEKQEAGSKQRPEEGGVWTKYDDFMAMSPAEQDAFMESFESMKAFKEWLLQAQKEWTEAHPTEELGPGGTIDFGN